MKTATQGWRLAAAPTMSTGMLIRRPASEVFRAMVDPSITTKFWFTKSTGPLAPNSTVQWTWEMYDVTGSVRVLEFEQDQLLVLENDPENPTTRVEMRFTSRSAETAFIEIEETGYTGETGDDVTAWALGSMGGYTQMLAALKAYLEHGIILTVVADRFPDAKPG